MIAVQPVLIHFFPPVGKLYLTLQKLLSYEQFLLPNDEV